MYFWITLCKLGAIRAEQRNPESLTYRNQTVTESKDMADVNNSTMAVSKGCTERRKRQEVGTHFAATRTLTYMSGNKLELQ